MGGQGRGCGVHSWPWLLWLGQWLRLLHVPVPAPILGLIPWRTPTRQLIRSQQLLYQRASCVAHRWDPDPTQQSCFPEASWFLPLRHLLSFADCAFTCLTWLHQALDSLPAPDRNPHSPQQSPDQGSEKNFSVGSSRERELC